MKYKTIYSDCPAYVTKDGSTIRELMHPAHHPVRNQSLAEATVVPGDRTERHVHPQTEELYHFIKGTGVMNLDGEEFGVGPGETVCIPPATAHHVENNGTQDLVFLCCCAPAYSHEDTVLVEE